MFFDQVGVIKYYFEANPKDEILDLGMALRGAQPLYTYEYQDSKGEEKTLKMQNVAAVICILNKSLECWRYILGKSLGYFSFQEVLDMVKMVCAENWKEGLDGILPYLEAAFRKCSIQTRVDFIFSLVEITSTVLKRVLEVPSICIFMEWMSTSGYESLRNYPVIKEVIPRQLPEKAKQLQRIWFLNRHQEKKKKQNEGLSAKKKEVIDENNMADLNEIYLENL
mmetsp:Transcript_18664/g.17776  ORF Transcript_18664/g.17776 Transcript_18664/m.17776 type:complete len:224 (-) Transcript_18664:42-713(-)